ncbi:MAG: biotin--[acetyl-CoA-carboxylase] ligase [Cytophagales bacterium]|nr:biotin--[acetyl-CoA-carboxylase] ligase [Cytophagales bacterium]
MYEIPKLISLKTCRSTQDVMHDLSVESPEGTTVWTLHQTHGKGVAGSWESEKGKNLLFSLLLKPSFLNVPESFLLLWISSLSSQKLISQYIPCQIKWPNDIYARDKKISGILIDTVSMGKRIREARIGVGINVHQSVFSDPEASSIRNLYEGTWPKIQNSREEVQGIKHMLHMWQNHFFPLYELLKSGERKKIQQAYESVLYGLGKVLNFYYQGKKIAARVQGLSPNGELILRTKDQSFLLRDKEITYLKKKHASP